MEVKVKHELKRSLNNGQHDLRNKTGYLLEILEDGYGLLEFSDIIVTRKFRSEILQWYIHETDFYIKR
jgi:hypothetical protein